jgi:hypothetical protein
MLYCDVAYPRWTFGNVLFFSHEPTQKSYETKQYKKGLKAADAILKKFPEHGGKVKQFPIYFFLF